MDCRVVEGKLFYEKRWYRRGQSIIVEPRQGDKYPAMISAIGEEGNSLGQAQGNFLLCANLNHKVPM